MLSIPKPVLFYISTETVNIYLHQQHVVSHILDSSVFKDAGLSILFLIDVYLLYINFGMCLLSVAFTCIK